MTKKTFLLVLALLVFGVSAAAFAMGGIGGSKAGSCASKSWGCNAWSVCYNGYYSLPAGSEARTVKVEEYEACQKQFVTGCMANVGCDAKEFFPHLFKD